MMFYIAYSFITVISRLRLTYTCIPGFNQYKAKALKCLDKGHCHRIQVDNNRKQIGLVIECDFISQHTL